MAAVRLLLIFALAVSAFAQQTAPSPKLRSRLMELNQDIRTKGILPLEGSSTKLLTGYSYGEFYDWDLYFENIYLSYYGVSDYNLNNLKAFLDRQKPDGFVSRSLIVKRDLEDFKPFLAQIAVLGSRQRHDFTWLQGKYYLRLVRYIDRWYGYDGDHNGLPVWNSADHSGMDNQDSRAGLMNSFTTEGVDLACYLYRELQAMAIIADQLGRKDEAAAYREQATTLAKTINAVFWDEKDGFYYDRNEKTGQLIRVKSIAGFTPLWAGIASKSQADRLVNEHLVNQNEFWLEYPVATYARTEPDYYQGVKYGECNWRGSAWIPTNYMIFHGLQRYGYRDVARELAESTQHMALDRNPVTREFYNAETGEGEGLERFWGWSSLAYVMPLELELNYDPTDLNTDIRPIIAEKWKLNF
jgi:hypothetical protein